MTSNRANLNDSGRNYTYLFLTIVLVVLSVVGIFFFFRIRNTNPTLTPPLVSTPTFIPSPTSEVFNVTPTIYDYSPTPIASISAKPSPSVKPSSSPKPTSTPRPTSTPKLTPTAASSPTPTPAFQTFTSDADKFTAIYQSNRKLYSDKESTGNRYTFYSTLGNFAVHVGSKWSWSYPTRDFSQTLLVSGYPTFVYEINTQTIVDFQVGDKLYTIQCVHNGQIDLKSECTKFLSDFKIN